jgi:site-specific DNA recombinase
MAARGLPLADIKRYLNSKEIKTVKGVNWRESTVKFILENVIYKGDFIMQKSYINEERKQVRNKGELDQWYIKDNHAAIVSEEVWDKVQEQIKTRRVYLTTGSIVGDLNETNYPYMNQIYCAKCGHLLYRRVYSNGNRVCWTCSGMTRYKKQFCEGINVPDCIVRSWGEIKGRVYIREEVNANNEKIFKYVKERTWKKNHTKKEKENVQTIPGLNEENYPYMNHIFCEKCGSRMVRLIKQNETIWICNGYKRKGKVFCNGTRIPDAVIRSWGDITKDLFIMGKEDKDGKKHYSYTSKEK